MEGRGTPLPRRIAIIKPGVYSPPGPSGIKVVVEARLHRSSLGAGPKARFGCVSVFHRKVNPYVKTIARQK
jgi:hypothetical protein